MKLHAFFLQFRVFIVTILAGLALSAMGALVVHFGVSAATANAENQELKAEIRDLVLRLAEVEAVLQEVEVQRKTLDRMTLAAVHTVIGQTTIDRENDGKLYLASLDSTAEAKQQNEALVGPPADLASVVSRMEQIKSDAHSLLRQLGGTKSGVSLRQEVLAAMPSRPPAKGWLSSDYGVRESPFHKGEKMHHGVDIAADVGTPVFATADGTVAFAGNNGGYGKYVRINHGFGIATRYAHNAELFVKKGQKVKRGDQIGVIGLTGRTTGPHVHYEILVKEQPVDPARFFFEEKLAKEPMSLVAQTEVKPMGGETETVVSSLVEQFAQAATLEADVAHPNRFLALAGEPLLFAAALPGAFSRVTTTDVILLTALLVMLTVASSLIRIPEPRKVRLSGSPLPAGSVIGQPTPRHPKRLPSSLGIWAGGTSDDEDEDA